MLYPCGTTERQRVKQEGAVPGDHCSMLLSWIIKDYILMQDTCKEWFLHFHLSDLVLLTSNLLLRLFISPLIWNLKFLWLVWFWVNCRHGLGWTDGWTGWYNFADPREDHVITIAQSGNSDCCLGWDVGGITGYMLKMPLNPNQPTNQPLDICVIVYVSAASNWLHYQCICCL